MLERAVRRFDDERFFVFSALGFDRDILKRRGQTESGKSVFRNAFQPYVLPDAADGRVPHTAALFALLSIGDISFEIVPNFDGQNIFSDADMLRDIEGERQISADVSTEKLSVEMDCRDLIDGAEMQKRFFVQKICRNGKRFFVDKALACFQRLFYARKARFGREGDTDVAEKSFFFFQNREKLPFSAKGKIGIARHLRTGINIPRFTVVFKRRFQLDELIFLHTRSFLKIFCVILLILLYHRESKKATPRSNFFMPWEIAQNSSAVE